MNREAIKKTAVCRFDSEEKILVVESPLLDIVTGASHNEDEAWEIFYDLLDACYIEYLEGKRVGQYQNRGRPAKGGISFNAQVKPSTKQEIATLAKNLGCSQGEAVDYLLASHNAGVSRGFIWISTKEAKKRSTGKGKKPSPAKKRA